MWQSQYGSSICAAAMRQPVLKLSSGQLQGAQGTTERHEMGERCAGRSSLCGPCSIYQEVWKSGKLYEYPAANLDNVKSVMGPLTDGWGVTTDQTSLIMSDGSSTLSWVDPASLTVTKSIKVGFVMTSYFDAHSSQIPDKAQNCSGADAIEGEL